MKKSKSSFNCVCINNNIEGKGIGKIGGEEVVIPYLLKGEKATVSETGKKKYKNYKISSISEKSPDRVEPKCKLFYKCGGCNLQHMNYEAQLALKEKYVIDIMKSFGKIDKIIGMENPYNYRNKIHSTISTNKKNEIISGIYKEYTHDIVPIDRCIIQDARADKIIDTLKNLFKSFKMYPYNEDLQKGFIRHVLIKTGFKTDQIMVVLVVANKIFPSKNNFVKALLKIHPEISTIIMNVNDRKTSAVLGNYEKTLYGKGFIEDVLLGLRFQISAKSFYQVNPIQTEKLYEKAIEFAELNGTETVLDAYSGIGTISLIAAKKAKEVIAVEINKDAVKNAKVNGKINNVGNVSFYEGDAGDFMIDFAERGSTLDVLFMDPPRSGSDQRFIESIGKLKPKRIIYISCNPETQGRDVKQIMKYGYKVKKIQPVDMFPWTGHVEAIVLMTRSGLGENK